MSALTVDTVWNPHLVSERADMPASRGSGVRDSWVAD